jgi:hypothetical protein
MTDGPKPDAIKYKKPAKCSHSKTRQELPLLRRMVLPMDSVVDTGRLQMKLHRIGDNVVDIVALFVRGVNKDPS